MVNLFDRHATLAASHHELKKHIADCESEIENMRQDLQQYLKNSANTCLTLNNDISVQRQKFDRKKQQTAELQLQIDSMIEMAVTRTLARSQVNLVLKSHNNFEVAGELCIT